MKTFKDDCQNEDNLDNIGYDAGYIDEEGTVCNQTRGAESTFSVGMPIYNMDYEYIGRLCLGSWDNLNIAFTKDLLGNSVPVTRWFVEGYTGPRQRIRTYWQKVAE